MNVKLPNRTFRIAAVIELESTCALGKERNLLNISQHTSWVRQYYVNIYIKIWKNKSDVAASLSENIFRN